MAYVSNPKGPVSRPQATGSTQKGKTTSPGVLAIKRTFAVIGRAIATIMLVGVITGCMVATVMSIYILRLVNTEDVIDLRNYKQNYTSIIYAEDPDTGESYELQRLIGGENRIWVGLEKIPKYTQQAFIAIEDKRFDDQLGEAHSGVDWRRTLYATAHYFIGDGSQGGSTITQQLIKNITGEDDVTIPRKVQEIFRAINVEKIYSKDDILEAYLNTIGLANNTNGVQAAANLYFGKDVGDLTLAESAAIAAITQYPEKYNPFSTKGKVSNQERREYILYEMLQQQRITQEEYDTALKESSTMTFKKEEAMQQQNSTQSYFVDNLIEEVIQDLIDRKGMTRSQAEAKLYSGGYRIYSTVNPKIQKILEDKFLDDATFKTITNTEPPQAAMVVTDTHGKILGIAGARGPKVQDRGFNYATQAQRQPGSSIKPISLYAQAIEFDVINYSSPIEDSPLENVKNGDSVLPNWPKNHYAGFKENMTVVRAIMNSTNTVAAKVCDMLSPRRCFDFMKNKLGITTLVEAEKAEDGRVLTDLGIAQLALGSLTHGVTVEEMTGAYQIFANGGTFTKPYSYTRVLDAATGEVVLENKEVYNRVISEESAYIMNRLLYQVVNGPEGTGRGAKVQGAEVIGKTGTSDDNYNQWFIGATPKYVAALWIGFERNKTVHYSSTYPPVYSWKQVMQDIVKLDQDPGKFPVSDGVVQQTYCVDSGGLALPTCPRTAVGYYKKNNLPSTCTMHLSGSSATTDDPFGDFFGSEDSTDSADTSSNWWE